MEDEKIWDVLIIGGGPAGLAAALYAARALRSTVVLESKMLPGGQIGTTGDVEDYPGIIHTTGPELSIMMQTHAEHFGAKVEFGQEVTSVDLSPPVKTVQVKSVYGDEITYRSRTVIIATGAAPRTLGVPGEDLLRGKGVSYCAVCDGPFFRDRHVAVVGGGDAAFDEGLYLTKYASRVTIIHRRESFRAQKLLVDRASKNGKIDFIMDTVVDRINGETALESIHLHNLKTGAEEALELGGVFVYIGSDPNTGIFSSCVSVDRTGYIDTDDNMATDCDGVFVAGDVRRSPLKQVVTAGADGSIAALTADKYLDLIDAGDTPDEAEAMATSKLSWKNEY
ncbi:MAG TPA: thioredoxin-disulfide reductase [Chloroflexota bacterium]|nr:thioredoxin-disulfide reductase [Chloroflexota bacterium]